jgi:hypothetical protein
MSVSSRIDDGGSIEATRRKMEQIQREGPKVFDNVVYKFMRGLRGETVRQMQSMGIRDTGALMSSTRVERQGQPARYDIAKREAQSNWKVISGGGGIYNYKNKREVDYAKPVHDGYATRGGTWVPGRPYLDMAWATFGPKWQLYFSEYLEWIQKEWGEDQPNASMLQFKLPSLEIVGG